MAPEQERGEVEQLDAQSDVYALGAVLFFLLSVRNPPAGGSVPPVAGVPRPLLAVCGKAMAAEKRDRYADASALAAEIARYLDGRRVEAYPESLFNKTARLYARHKVAFWLIVTYVVVRGSLLFLAGR
jgi:serine/threonine-protein kinase